MEESTSPPPSQGVHIVNIETLSEDCKNGDDLEIIIQLQQHDKSSRLAVGTHKNDAEASGPTKKIPLLASPSLQNTIKENFSSIFSSSKPRSTRYCIVHRDAEIRNKVCNTRTIKDMKTRFKFLEKKQDDDDLKSTAAIINKINSKCDESVVFHKLRGDTSDQFPYLCEDKICIVIQTEFQEIQYRLFGKNLVCFDKTFNLTTTSEGVINLLTIICVDEWEEGVPVMWAIHNVDDVEIISVMLTLLRDKFPQVFPKRCMADVDSIAPHVFQQVFNERRFFTVYSSWSVRKNMTELVECYHDLSQHDRFYILDRLEYCLNCPNEQKFHQIFNMLTTHLCNNERSKELGETLKREYGDRVLYWAAWVQSIKLHDLMIYKSHLFKHLNTDISRIDELLNGLYQTNIDLLDTLHLQLSTKTVRQRIINECHVESESMSERDFSFIRYEDTFKFKKDDHIVGMGSCPMDFCSLQCEECRICIHMYNCTCREYVTKHTICKHIHYVVGTLMYAFETEASSENELSNGTNSDTEPGPSRKRKRITVVTTASLCRSIRNMFNSALTLLEDCEDIDVIANFKDKFQKQFLEELTTTISDVLL